jgi:hypothetical protein
VRTHVEADVVSSGVAATVTIEAGQRIAAAELKVFTQNV